MINRRNFIKGVTAGLVAINFFPEKVFAEENLRVKTRYGTFNGVLNENGVKTWLGIPYAQPPVKNLRWQPPQKLNTSNKIFDAKKFGNDPMQAQMKLGNLVDEFDHNESEDCLTLNIWKKSDKKNLPVMIWIFGGGFVGGSSSDSLYNASNFVSAHDIIIVTINYRMNVFGFMNLAEIDKNFSDSGYLGIKDQIAAVKWVKENISEFGGNPENITIFGESAGSISTFFLTIAPDTKNLFQKVIPQSGAVNFYKTPEDSAQMTENFMKSCGAKNISDLMKKSAVELQKDYAKFTDSREMNVADFYPTCDGKFLPENPLQALKTGAARGIKILTGNTADEWRVFLIANENLFDLMRKDAKNISPIFSRYKKENNEEVYKKWLKNRPDTADTYGDFSTQIDWRVSQEICAEYQSNFEDVYFYLFTQKPSPPLEYLGAYHALDLSYTFNVPYLETNPNQNLVKIIQASWAAFAATGNPNNEFIPHWEKYSAQNRQTMELNSEKCICHKDLNTENLNSLRYVYES